MTLAEVAAKIREEAPFDGSVDAALKRLERDPDFTLRERVVKAAALVQGDPHQWSHRPCNTCRKVSDLLDVRFGCYAPLKVPT